MGFLIAAIITALLTALIVGSIALRAAGPPRSLPLIALASALPLHAASLYLLRLPLHGVLKEQLSPDVLFWVGGLYAPLLEEPAKWLVLILPFIVRRLTPQNAIGVALAVGLGFGLGEIGTLTVRTLIAAPETTHLPFYIYTGFLVERLLVCFLHGAMIALVALRLAEGRPVWPAMLLGLMLHYLVNLPIALMQIEAFGIGRDVWLSLAMPWLIVMTLGLAVYLAAQVQRTSGRALLGEATCGACGTPFERSLLAFNVGPWKLQRCPHCGRWQLV